MTCIVGLVSGSRVVMGADSAAVDTASLSLDLRIQPKVFRNGSFLIGYTSSFRMGQLLEHAFSPPAMRVGQDAFAFMVAEFVPAVRRCFEVGGWARQDSGVHSGGSFLVAYAGRLFCIESDFQVAEHARGYHAIGCGDQTALGALFVTETLSTMGPVDRVMTALEAAAAGSAGVAAPFHIDFLEPSA